MRHLGKHTLIVNLTNIKALCSLTICSTDSKKESEVWVSYLAGKAESYICALDLERSTLCLVKNQSTNVS